MSRRPKITSVLKKLIKKAHNGWAYHCLGQDIEYNSDHLMNVFTCNIIDECENVFEETKRYSGKQIREMLSNHLIGNEDEA